MLDDIRDKFAEHIDYLNDTSDAIQSGIDKIKSLFTGESLSKLGGFLGK